MFWSLLKAELGAPPLPSVPTQEPAEKLSEEASEEEEEEEEELDAASTRVYNFLVLPWHFEQLCIFGFSICLDCFLYLFTLLPLKWLQFLVNHFRHGSFRELWELILHQSPSARSPGKRRRMIPSKARADARQWSLWLFSRIVVLLAGTTALCFVDMSRMYHYIRGQSVLKLYVIFNMLQICDRMFASFGEDILEALYVGGRRGHLWMLHLAAACLYVFLHSLLLFCQVITLNVSVNSSNNSIFIILVSNNFVELKQCVFKRFKEANLFQVTCADVVERFQIFVFVTVVMVQNLSHVGLAEAPDWVLLAFLVCLGVFGSEVLVDWIKHGFMTKFNRMPPAVYRQFHELLCLDFCNSYQSFASRILLADRGPPSSPSSPPSASSTAPPRRQLHPLKKPRRPSSARVRPLPHYHSISRRFGFSSFPMVCLFLRVVFHAFSTSHANLLLKICFLAVAWVACVLLKLLLSIYLLGHSAAFPGSLFLHPPTEDGRTNDAEELSTLKTRLVRFSSDVSTQEVLRTAAYNLHARGGVSIDFSSGKESFNLDKVVDRFSMQGSKIY